MRMGVYVNNESTQRDANGGRDSSTCPELRLRLTGRYWLTSRRSSRLMKQNLRSEQDSMGPMQVPAEAYYGAQTARAVENFPISNLRFPRQFIRALGLIKKHAAAANEALGLLPSNISRAVQSAAQEVVEGKWDAQFVVDIFQTGSGTST